MQILVVEDNEQIARLINVILEGEGYRVKWVVDVASAHDVLRSSDPPDLMLLDMVLPDEDGLVLARQIRTRSSIPIMVLSAREKLSDRLAALELGVDDYMVKPFAPEELVLRVRNLLARAANGNAGNGTANDSVIVGKIHIDGAARQVSYNGDRPVSLTTSEFDLLMALAKSPGIVLSRGRLIDAINRGNEPPSSRVVDVLVGRIRKKFGAVSDDETLIETVSGVGYRLHQS